MNYHQDNLLKPFVLRMSEAGISYEGPFIIDNNFHRFHIEGDKPSSKNGWYILNELNGVLFGSFGCFKRGVFESWKEERKQGFFSCKAYNQIVLFENQKKTEQKYIVASQHAHKLWNSANAVHFHPYLSSKRVLAHGLKVKNQVLYVPIRDMHGKLWSIEKIYSDGTKIRLPSSKSNGCFHILGEMEGKIIIAEGYSTAASLYQASGICTVVAFSVSGLSPVALEFRRYFPELEIIIAADDDYSPNSKNNLGLTTAIDVARSINGKYIKPKFKSRPRMKCDFNDMLVVDGMDFLKKYLEDEL